MCYEFQASESKEDPKHVMINRNLGILVSEFEKTFFVVAANSVYDNLSSPLFFAVVSSFFACRVGILTMSQYLLRNAC